MVGPGLTVGWGFIGLVWELSMGFVGFVGFVGFIGLMLDPCILDPCMLEPCMLEPCMLEPCIFVFDPLFYGAKGYFFSGGFDGES